MILIKPRYFFQNNGSIWIATDEGLNVFYDDEKQVFYSNIEDSLSLLNSKVDKLFNTSEDKLMVLSQGGVSVFSYDNFNFRQIIYNHLLLKYSRIKGIMNFGFQQKVQVYIN